MAFWLIQSPPFSVPVLYTIAARRRVCDNCAAHLWVEVVEYEYSEYLIANNEWDTKTLTM